MSRSDRLSNNHSFYRDYGKRALDVSLVLITLPLTISLIVLVAFAVWLFLGAPVIFRQVRPGFRAKPFGLCKFRTMTEACDASGMLLSDGQRLTAFGRLLRSSSFDELPELWNVLLGHMSLVGPRPLLMEYLPRYTPEQWRRHDVRPGLTGLAQIRGRNTLRWEEKFALDIDYARRISLALDLKILLLTVRSVLRREGISTAGEATMPLFTGSATESPLPPTNASAA